jgi:hypothetical protein
VSAGNACRIGAIAVGLLAASMAHADYKDSYARGLKAFRDGNLADARTLMQQAESEHAEPAVKMRLYGQVYEPYVPQHYLGLIAFKQGDCAGALAQWNSAPNRSIAAEIPDIAGEQQRDSSSCASKVAVAKKEEKPAEILPPPTKPVEAPAKTVAKNNPPPVAPPVVPSPKPPPEKAPVASKGEPPPPLVQAFDDYLAGQYSEVARINPDAYADAHARYHAYLVRAASKFTLSKISADDQLLNGARSDVRAARALEATTPDAALFSPAFRSFYQENR